MKRSISKVEPVPRLGTKPTWLTESFLPRTVQRERPRATVSSSVDKLTCTVGSDSG